MSLPSIFQVLQHVTRIAEVLLALRLAGNVTYSGHAMIIKCAVYMACGSGQEQELQEELAKEHVAKLNACAKQMESALEEWKNEVNKSRSHYYELNYYTTRQLLLLRREVGFARHNPHKQIDPEVLALLQSISPAVTTESVHSVLAKLEKLNIDIQAAASLVLKETHEVEMETQLCEDDMPPLEADGSDACDVHLVETSPISTVVPSSKTVMPQLAEQDLNDIQKQILTDLVEYQGYPRLLAFEECGEVANDYDVADWCAENEKLRFDDNKKEVDTENIADSVDESSSESDSSDEEEEDLSMFVQQQLSPTGTVLFRILRIEVGFE